MKSTAHSSKRKLVTLGSILATTLMLLAQTHKVSAQWQGSPNIYYNGGNVGIGRSPGARLDVYQSNTTNGDILLGYFTRTKTDGAGEYGLGIYNNGAGLTGITSLLATGT